MSSSVSESGGADALGESVGAYALSALHSVSHRASGVSAWLPDGSTVGWAQGVSNALRKGKALLFDLFVITPVVRYCIMLPMLGDTQTSTGHNPEPSFTLL